MLHTETWAETTRAGASRGERLRMLSRLFHNAAALNAADADETRVRAKTALARLLRKDPGLEHFREIVEALRFELAAHEVRVARIVPEAPLTH